MRKRRKLRRPQILAIRCANAEVLAQRAIARCDQVEALVGLVVREFRGVVDQSETRMRAMVTGERAVIENLTSALTKLREPTSRISVSFEEARRAAKFANKKRRGA